VVEQQEGAGRASKEQHLAREQSKVALGRWVLLVLQHVTMLLLCVVLLVTWQQYGLLITVQHGMLRGAWQHMQKLGC